jgi:hypothetical protein
MQNAGIYVSKTTVQVNETDMQERRQKLLNLNKIRGFDESHPISVSGDARYKTVWKVVWEKLLSNQLFQHFAWHCMKARVCLLTRIMHVDLRLQVGNFGDQHEFLSLQLSNFVPF